MFIRKFGFDLFDDPFNRFLLFAEGDDGDGGGGESGDDAGKQGDGESGKSKDGDDAGKAAAAAAAGNGETDDWRLGIKDEKLRDHAGRYTTMDSMAQSNVDFRKQLSTAIQPLGKDPTDEQVAKFRKTSGIPETIEGYEFTVPEGHEVTDADKAFQKSAAEVFHKFNVSTETAKGLGEWWNEVTAATLQAQIDGDKAYANETMAALKTEWPGKEFDTNKAFADQAITKIFGDAVDEVRAIEGKDGKFVLDHPAFIKMFAQYGREMQEGRLGNIMTDSDLNDNDTQIAELEKKIDKATFEGDRELANTLYQQQQELYRKAYGAGSIVGAEGRVA